MQFSWTLFTILGLAAATPLKYTEIREGLLSHNVHTRNAVLENLILRLLEDFRVTMQNGSGDVPVLDPLQIAALTLDEEILPLPGSHLSLCNPKISKLSTFVVDSLRVRSTSIILQRYRVEFQISIPVVDFEADSYDLLLKAFGTSIFGKGDATIHITNPRIIGSLVVAPRFSIQSGIYLTILDSQVSFDMDDFDSRINGLMNDDHSSAFINSFLKHFVPEAVKLYEPQITEFLSRTVMDAGNAILEDINLADILG